MDTISARFLGMPHTKLGWWAVGLSLLFAFLFVAVTSQWFHFPGILLMTFGVIGGILNLIALVWKHERSWLVWLMLLPGLFAIVFALGEILYPH